MEPTHITMSQDQFKKWMREGESRALSTNNSSITCKYRGQALIKKCIEIATAALRIYKYSYFPSCS
jgi:hypothetical protein